MTVSVRRMALAFLVLLTLGPASLLAALPGSFTLSNNTPVCDTNAPAVRLNWSVSSGATSYDLYRNGTLYSSGIGGTTFYNSANLTAGQSYTYFVQAKNSSGATNSNTISVSIPVNICATGPGSFTLSNNAPVCDTNAPAVRLNWTVSSGATSYDLYRNGALYSSGIGGTTYYNSANLTAGQSYTYFVQARNSAGATNSNTISVSIPANICATGTGIVHALERRTSVRHQRTGGAVELGRFEWSNLV